MARKGNCGLCENANLPSICAACVNNRLVEHYATLKALRARRDSLYRKISGKLASKLLSTQQHKAADQYASRTSQNEKVNHLKENLRSVEVQVMKGKATLEKKSYELKIRHEALDTAFLKLETNRVELLGKSYPNLICTLSLGHMAITSELLHKQSLVIKQLCRLFPQRRVTAEGDIEGTSGNHFHDQICNARLPRGLDPHSVPVQELGASLGYMVHLVSLAARYLAVPMLHNSGFACSSSRIWQRASYCDARPSSRSNEYPLFISRQSCSVSAESSWSGKSTTDFGVTSMESGRKSPLLDGVGSSSFNYSNASLHSIDTHKEVQKGISLLKKSVACITAYCYNSLHLDIPTELSTFEAFAKLLYTLSSAKQVRSALPMQTSLRSPKQVHLLNKPTLQGQLGGNSLSSSIILDASVNMMSVMHHIDDVNASTFPYFLRPEEFLEPRVVANTVEGWDIIEHPIIPPPSQAEDIEHWTRAMFTDATRRDVRRS